MSRLPRTAHEQAKRWAVGWATAESQARTIPGAPIVVHQARVVRWTGILRRAGISTPDRPHSGLRPSLDGVINLGTDPVWAADQIAEDPKLLNLRLRSCTAALWLYTLQKEPARVRRCGRTYSPTDCAPFFLLVEDMLRDSGLALWLYHYACELGWHYEQQRGQEHTGQALLARLRKEAA